MHRHPRIHNGRRNHVCNTSRQSHNALATYAISDGHQPEQASKKGEIKPY